MPTSTGHTRAIPSSKVVGSNVYDARGEHLGHVEDVVLDKLSNTIMFAVLGFGGLLGIGEKYHAMPWSMLDYDEAKGGYVVPLDPTVLAAAPVYELADLIAADGAATSPDLTYYAKAL
ncbi:PRC-barrel domain-containing protein [Pinisolibacter aquiterrae]|uniref:PRC-barrel domain-containing protein n=1 Tax=Pinisolibacter aquiterrae TaxID=2815579 RepID=UPI001C3C5C6C|nr:PRC-barrel domain-containing protein [Pinisolibacter aquiterrae]MBV5263847.1 PRC-barrel domain-containing protein [Pinisolibacter aquiterrae]MCC8237240.1 PRC-barrel domain-containing protein [Pinisolibacter aquiterrae]